jgi:FkbM family methyltransferase
MTLSSFMSTALLLLAVAAWKQAAAGIVGMLSKVRDRTGGSWKPDGIVDVGANTGEWTREVRGLFPDAKILMVEATPMHEDTLRRVAEDVGNAEYRIAVCTARDGEKVGYYQGKNTGNSLFRENTKHYENDAPVQRTSATVDSLVRSSLLGDGPVDVIKADVQGAELLVLQGATRALGQASFVYLEASTIEYNQGAPCFYEVDAFLRSRGYYLYDIADLNYNVAFKTFGLGQYDGRKSKECVVWRL